MRSFPRTLALILVGTLAASAAEAQGVFTTPPDTTIGVQLQVIPFGNVQGYRAPPQVTFIGPAEGRLSCPMPVLRDNSSGDISILVTPLPRSGGEIVVDETPATGCRNPLFQPRPMQYFVW